MTHPLSPRFDRRHLLGSALGLAGAAALSPSTAARATSGSPRPVEEPPFRISLAQWSLHRTLGAGELDPLDFAPHARSSFGLDAVEYVNRFLAGRAADFGYLTELARRAADAGVASLLIMIDGEGSLAAEDDSERRRAIENHFKWIAAARFLGCHSVRVNAAGSGDAQEMARRAADSLVRLADLAEPYELNILVENHGGRSSNGAWLADVMRRADHPRVGTLPDFGNFRISPLETYDRYDGVTELMPFAKAVSAKSHEFDHLGNEVHTDYERMLRIVVDAGFRGHIGIEYEGSKHSEAEGIRLTRDLLHRVRATLDPTPR